MKNDCIRYLGAYFDNKLSVLLVRVVGDTRRLGTLGLIRDTVRAPYNTSSGVSCVKSLWLCLNGVYPQSGPLRAVQLERASAVLSGTSSSSSPASSSSASSCPFAPCAVRFPLLLEFTEVLLLLWDIPFSTFASVCSALEPLWPRWCSFHRRTCPCTHQLPLVSRVTK